jgi:hypothetical protein
VCSLCHHVCVLICWWSTLMVDGSWMDGGTRACKARFWFLFGCICRQEGWCTCFELLGVFNHLPPTLSHVLTNTALLLVAGWVLSGLLVSMEMFRLWISNRGYSMALVSCGSISSMDIGLHMWRDFLIRVFLTASTVNCGACARAGEESWHQ